MPLKLKHGGSNAYDRFHCRCEECRKYKSAQNAKRKLHKRVTNAPEGRDVKPPRVGGPGCLQPCGGFVTTAAELADGPSYSVWKKLLGSK